MDAGGACGEGAVPATSSYDRRITFAAIAFAQTSPAECWAYSRYWPRNFLHAFRGNVAALRDDGQLAGRACQHDPHAL